MGMQLMKEIPQTMQDVPNYKHHRHSTPHDAEHSEDGDSAGFESPGTCTALFGVVPQESASFYRGFLRPPNQASTVL